MISFKVIQLINGGIKIDIQMDGDFKVPGISTGSLESGHGLVAVAAGVGRPGPCIARSTAGTLQSRSTS